jgi:hypothetical protein
VDVGVALARDNPLATAVAGIAEVVVSQFVGNHGAEGRVKLLGRDKNASVFVERHANGLRHYDPRQGTRHSRDLFRALRPDVLDGGF